MDGSNVEDIVTNGLGHPEGIAVDVAGGKVYWADDGTAQIARANLDGSDVQTLVGSGLDDPIPLALDLGAGKMYWADGGIGRLQRANLDGSNVENVITSGLAGPTGIALDTDAQHIYFSNQFLGNIQRANYDGSNVQTVVQDTRLIFDVELDLANGKIYWAAEHPSSLIGSIHRANLDGSDVETIHLFDGPDDFGLPIGLAIDSFHGRLFWTDPRYDRIRRSNLDGTGVVDIVTGLSNPQFLALAIIPEPGSIATVVFATAMLVAGWRGRDRYVRRW